MRSQHHRILSTIIAVAIQLACWAIMAQTPNAPAELMGTVNGSQLQINKISVDMVTQIFVVRHKREPHGAEDEMELKAEVERCRCNTLRRRIEEIAREVEKARLGIQTTNEELTLARLELARGTDTEAAAAMMRDRAKAAIAALAEVYDKGRDANEVFQSMLQGTKYIDEATWALYLFKGKSPQYRVSLQRELLVTPERVQEGIARMDVRLLVEQRKLDRAVDEEIASQDSTFRTYLVSASHSGRQAVAETPGIILSNNQYMKAKREEYWRAKYSRLQVMLNDPNLSVTCALSEMGGGVSTLAQ